jgi:hypothetical protein
MRTEVPRLAEASWRPSRGFSLLLAGVAVADLGLAILGYVIMNATAGWESPFKNPFISDNPNLIPFVLCCVLACACTAAYSVRRGSGASGPLLMIATHLMILVSFIVGILHFQGGHEEGIGFVFFGGPITILVCVLAFSSSGWALRRRSIQ